MINTPSWPKLTASLENEHPAPEVSPTATPAARRPLPVPPEAVWITTHWKVANDLSIERIPGRASQRSGELVYCTWYEPRRSEPGAWMHFSDVEPRDTTRRRPTEQR